MCLVPALGVSFDLFEGRVLVICCLSVVCCLSADAILRFVQRQEPSCDIVPSCFCDSRSAVLNRVADCNNLSYVGVSLPAGLTLDAIFPHVHISFLITARSAQIQSSCSAGLVLAVAFHFRLSRVKPSNAPGQLTASQVQTLNTRCSLDWGTLG